MSFRALLSRSLAALLMALPLGALPLIAGCGDDSEVAIPADEPNVGPGGPPGESPAKKGTSSAPSTPAPGAPGASEK